MIVKELKVIIFENYHQWMGFDKEDSYYSMKHQMKKKSAIFCNKVNRKITWSSSC